MLQPAAHVAHGLLQTPSLMTQLASRDEATVYAVHEVSENTLYLVLQPANPRLLLATPSEHSFFEALQLAESQYLLAALFVFLSAHSVVLPVLTPSPPATAALNHPTLRFIRILQLLKQQVMSSQAFQSVPQLPGGLLQIVPTLRVAFLHTQPDAAARAQDPEWRPKSGHEEAVRLLIRKCHAVFGDKSSSSLPLCDPGQVLHIFSPPSHASPALAASHHILQHGFGDLGAPILPQPTPDPFVFLRTALNKTRRSSSTETWVSGVLAVSSAFLADSVLATRSQNLALPEFTFSHQNAISLVGSAFEAYCQDLPPLYSRTAHSQRLQNAISLLTASACGPAVGEAIAELNKRCTAYFTPDRQLCDAASLSDHLCILAVHKDTPHKSEVPIAEYCLCGQTRRDRGDYFTTTPEITRFFRNIRLL
eukprot:TRINITY_DN9730_c0_g1_i1.p1 TRINITY_DN9730_c0_g1~~TRINITY_DN9730_c0_g1_i1.p1  ORF type:complete len:437 (-),score=95.69 TRINITY_DN9730_c0_g1_i1:941-2206(-)